jgi:hypothetical protein
VKAKNCRDFDPTGEKRFINHPASGILYTNDVKNASDNFNKTI